MTQTIEEQKTPENGHDLQAQVQAELERSLREAHLALKQAAEDNRRISLQANKAHELLEPLHNKINELQEANTEKNAELHKLRRMAADRKLEIDNLLLQLDRLGVRNKQLSEESTLPGFEMLAKELDERIKTSEAHSSELEEENARLRSEIKQLEAHRQADTGKIEDLRRHNWELARDVDAKYQAEVARRTAYQLQSEARLKSFENTIDVMRDLLVKMMDRMNVELEAARQR